MPVTVKATVVRDTSAIDQLALEVVKVEANSTLLLECSLLCLTAFDEKDAVVGFLCLDDTPCARLGDAFEGSDGWLEGAAQQRMRLCSTAFLRAYVVNQLYEIEASGALLRAAFTIVPSLQLLFMATAQNISFTEPGLASVFSRVTAVAKDPANALQLYEGGRAGILPPLAIRPARVEDHDDMLPILQHCEATFPALAQLPPSSNPGEPFALARVVANQDAANRVLVAQDATSGELVGFMVVTSDVDTGSLAETFDLHPYDNFLPPEVYEEQYAAARESVRSQKLALLRAELARRDADKAEKAAFAATLSASNSQVPMEVPAAGSGAAAAGGADASTQADGGDEDGGGGGGGGEGGEGGAEGGEEGRAEAEARAQAEAREAELEAAAAPTEEETRAELLAMFSGRPDNVEPTLFAITMLCVAPGYEEQASEFLAHAFAAFPHKLYSVVTLPHDSPEPAMMRVMARVAPQPGSLYPEVLFMFSCHALNPSFTVRLGAAEDLEQVAALTDGMPNSTEIQESFLGAAGAGTAVVAVVQGEIVGLATINPEVDLELLQANFALSSHIDLAVQPRDQHGEIDMLTMNPIFGHHHRDFLAGSMRLLGKTALYYALPPGQQPPDMLDVLDQVAPRHRVNDKLQAEFALYIFTRRAAFQRRRCINAQVVVVGASECGLAVVERLLLDPELQFNYITLLAPGGIKVGGAACQYTAGIVAKLGLEARVLLLDAEMVGLDRQARVVELSDGSQLAYDQLVITAGLQDQSRYRYADQDPDCAGLLVTELELAADFSMNDAISMNSIVVAGESLGAYHAMSVLEAKGAGDKVRFVAPPGGRPPVVGLLHEAAAAAGIPLPSPEPKEVSRLSLLLGGHPGELRATAFLVDPADPGPQEEVVADLLVGCEPPSAGRALFTCLNDASLVFDGRLVVDGTFCTNDPKIYAGGTLARLSRRYGGTYLQHYNSRDVGRQLAASLAARHGATPARGVSAPAADGQPPPPPMLQQARVVGCGLPGGLNFLFAGRPAALNAPAMGAPEGGLTMSTTSERGYMQVNLDASDCVHSIIYLGRVPVPAARISALVGLHGNYLAGMVPKYQAGEVRCLLTFLLDTWAEMLYHDGFGDFRAQLLDLALASIAVGGRDVEGGLVEMVTAAQDAVLEFARARASELPGYQVPAAARAARG